MRVPSISSSRQRRLLAGGCLVLSLAGGVVPRPAEGQALETRLEQLLERSQPSIVRIDVRRAWDDRAPEPTPQNPHPALAVRRVQGNGIVWDSYGHIVTVADLAQPGDTLWVYATDGSFAKGEFVAQDPDLGVSLIHVHGMPSLRPLPHAADFPPAAAWVLTLAFPTIGSTGSSPPLLALARAGSPVEIAGRPRNRLAGAGDPGLAGGGVMDGEGRFLGLLMGEGIESLLLDAGRRLARVEYCIRPPGPSETGWVVPIAELERAVPLLLQPGRVTQGFLGVRVDLPPGQDPVKGGPGVTVTGVLPGSPAQLGGLRQGDRLVGFDGVPVVGWDELTQQVAQIRPGRKIRVGVVRGGQPMSLDVEVADRAHSIWRQKQRQMASGKEKMLRHQIEGLRQQLELLRHQLLSSF